MTHNVFVNTETLFVNRLQKRRNLYCTLDSTIKLFPEKTSKSHCIFYEILLYYYHENNLLDPLLQFGLTAPELPITIETTLDFNLHIFHNFQLFLRPLVLLCFPMFLLSDTLVCWDCSTNYSGLGSVLLVVN